MQGMVFRIVRRSLSATHRWLSRSRLRRTWVAALAAAILVTGPGLVLDYWGLYRQVYTALCTGSSGDAQVSASPKADSSISQTALELTQADEVQTAGLPDSTGRDTRGPRVLLFVRDYHTGYPIDSVAVRPDFSDRWYFTDAEGVVSVRIPGGVYDDVSFRVTKPGHYRSTDHLVLLKTEASPTRTDTVLLHRE